MTTPFTYDFGYSWPVAWGYLIPIALFGGLAGLGLWLGWRRWLVVASILPAAWGIVGLATIHTFGINLPHRPPTDRFLASGSGRVVDVGAGSGRAAVGLLLARPRVTVTGVDIYRGYYGIDDNTPERFMVNARIAGVADRAEAIVGDARELPLATGEYRRRHQLVRDRSPRSRWHPKGAVRSGARPQAWRRISPDARQRRLVWRG